jgi:hypothetical protein
MGTDGRTEDPRSRSAEKRVDVVVNATAHLHRERPALAERMRRVAGARAEVHTTASVAELAATADRLAERGSDVVFLSGGDGSFMAGVTELARAFGRDRLPAIGLLPGGTVATVARNWGMRGDPAELLERALAGDLETTARPTLRVRAARPSGAEDRIGFIFGTGLVASFFELYYGDGARGNAAAARLVARIFVESFYGGPIAKKVLTPLPCRLTVDGGLLGPSAWSLLCASVVKDLGIHMLVTYRAGDDPERIHLVASALSPRELGPRAPRVLAGKTIGGANHFDDLVRRFTVSFADAAPTNGAGGEPHEGPYVLDGDILRASEVEVAPGPMLRVIDGEVT